MRSTISCGRASKFVWIGRICMPVVVSKTATSRLRISVSPMTDTAVAQSSERAEDAATVQLAASAIQCQASSPSSELNDVAHEGFPPAAPRSSTSSSTGENEATHPELAAGSTATETEPGFITPALQVRLSIAQGLRTNTGRRRSVMLAISGCLTFAQVSHANNPLTCTELVLCRSWPLSLSWH